MRTGALGGVQVPYTDPNLGVLSNSPQRREARLRDRPRSMELEPLRRPPMGWSSAPAGS